MRWIVEVQSLEGQQAQSYCVEAESWQGALQSARRIRGDESRMAGFSIDITNEGCKAVDPAKKLRYDVKRTADSTPLTPGGEAQPASSKRTNKTSAVPPRPESKPAPAPTPDQTVKLAAVIVEPDPPKPVAAPAPVAVAPAPQIVVPPIMIKREQEATAEVPLTYREYGFALPAGTNEAAAVNTLLQMLAHIQSAIASTPPGRLVNLAAFDQQFQGRAPVLPLATLTWKDWKPEPTIAYPRRDHATKAAPVAVAVAAPVAVALSFEPAVVIAPEVQAPVSQTRSKPPVPKRRVRGDELISVLFESMHDLHFLRDSIEGGDFCAALAMEKLPSRVAFIYLYDIDRREFVVVCGAGVAPQGIIGTRLAETESVLAAAMRKRRAIVLDASDPTLATHAASFGGAKSLLLAPVMQAGRFLGAIEIVDPTDAAPFSELDANAITYMAEQFAEFVAARGVLLDRERSSQPPVVTH